MNFRGIGCIAGTLTVLSLVLFGTACSKSSESGSASFQMPKANEEVVDIDVTTKVRTALLRAVDLGRFDNGVVSSNGDVRLRGVVDTRAQLEQAIKIARETNGVHSIHDELTVKK